MGSCFPAVDLAVDMLPDLARQAGPCRCGFRALTTTSAWSAGTSNASRRPAWSRWRLPTRRRAIAAWGGRRQLYGTNPIAFACPHQGQAPIVVDLALSQVARGTILTAAQRGEPVPTSWATDADGKPTSDAKAALKGGSAADWRSQGRGAGA
jgi:(2R)-3-sulfolactate dehydrogenase (NADP+)